MLSLGWRGHGLGMVRGRFWKESVGRPSREGEGSLVSSTMLKLRDLKLTRIDRLCDAFWTADASFGSISFVLYLWCGLVGVSES
jgi:hypothetical protein